MCTFWLVLTCSNIPPTYIINSDIYMYDQFLTSWVMTKFGQGINLITYRIRSENVALLMKIYVKNGINITLVALLVVCNNH